jgi:hypothetical protein
MSDMVDPGDLAAFSEEGDAGNQTVRELRAKATPLGLGVASMINIAFANTRVGAESPSEPLTLWYRIYPLDDPDDDEVFETAEEAHAYLDSLAT